MPTHDFIGDAARVVIPLQTTIVKEGETARFEKKTKLKNCQKLPGLKKKETEKLPETARPGQFLLSKFNNIDSKYSIPHIEELRYFPSPACVSDQPDGDVIMDEPVEKT